MQWSAPENAKTFESPGSHRFRFFHLVIDKKDLETVTMTFQLYVFVVCALLLEGEGQGC